MQYIQPEETRSRDQSNAIASQMTNLGMVPKEAFKRQQTLSLSIDDFIELFREQPEENTILDPIPLQSPHRMASEHTMAMILDQALTQIEPDFDHDPFNSSLMFSSLGTIPDEALDTNIPDHATSLPKRQIEHFDGGSSAKKRRTVDSAASSVASSAMGEYSTSRFRPYQQEQWDIQFQALLAFKQANGHCSVPHTYEQDPILSRWTKRQRYQYKLRMEGKTSTMTAARIQVLEAAGFVWDSHGEAWQERYNELRAYRAIHGNCNVPSTYPANVPLSTWVKCQRRQYKLFCKGESSNMSVERIAALTHLGFEFERQLTRRHQ